MKMSVKINSHTYEVQTAWTNEQERKFCYLVMGIVAVVIAFVKVVS